MLRTDRWAQIRYRTGDVELDVMPAKAAKAWAVEEGAIVGDGDKGRSYLVFDKKDIADFEMKLSYRFPGKGNSGISIRARKDPTGKRGFQSYHADFGHVGIGRQVLGAWDFHTPGRREHACDFTGFLNYETAIWDCDRMECSNTRPDKETWRERNVFRRATAARCISAAVS